MTALWQALEEHLLFYILWICGCLFSPPGQMAVEVTAAELEDAAAELEAADVVVVGVESAVAAADVGDAD